MIGELYQQVEGLAEVTFKLQTTKRLLECAADTLRRLFNFVEKFSTPDVCFAIYWFCLIMVNCVERLQAAKLEHAELNREQQEQAIREELTQKIAHDLTKAMSEKDIQKDDKIATLETKLAAATQRISELEHEAYIREQNRSKMMSEVEMSPIMERLEGTYGKVREAMNNTFENEFQYMHSRLILRLDNVPALPNTSSSPRTSRSR